MCWYIELSMSETTTWPETYSEMPVLSVLFKETWTIDAFKSWDNPVCSTVVKNLCNELATIIQQYNIKNIVDCGCGSFNYLIPLVDFLHKNINSYIGIDIVDHIIDDNKKYSNNKFNFIIDDICSTDKIQNADLVICKEVLMHISTKLINDFFRNLKNRNVKYVLISSFRNEKSPPRVDGVSGLGVLFKINLFTNPYNFGGPLEVITESDKSDDAKLYMWRVSELPDL